MFARVSLQARATTVFACRRRMLMRHGLLLVAGLGLTVGFAGCKTTGREDTEQLLHKADIVPSSGGADDLGRVPMSLWSPLQRRASATHYYLVAEYVALSERNGSRALPFFETAYSLDPNPFLGGRMLAAKASAGQRDEALLEARKMVLLYPRDVRLRQMYGEMLGASGDAGAAIEQLEKCIEIDPKREPCYLQLSELYQVTKQPARAIVVSRELVKKVPGALTGWAQLARLLLIGQQYKEALEPARRAWEMQSQNPALAQMYAITLQLNGKTKQAMRIYEQLYRMDPTDEDLTARMVDLYRELGNLDNALSLLEAMEKEESKGKPAVRMQKAIVLWELKRFQEAAALLTQLAKEFPDSDRLRYLSGVGYERLDRFDDALVAYGQVPANSPFKHQAELRSLFVLKAMKRTGEAIKLADKILENPQADWETFAVIADLYADAAQFAEAINTADAGYRRFPDKPRLLFLKGVFQERAGEHDACIETMRQVIVKDPRNSSAFNYLGYLFVERGENLDEAEQLIKKALELKPDDGFYLDSLGWLYFQRKEYDKALKYLERASQIEPKEGVILEHLGDVKRMQGQKDAARALYLKALTVNLEAKDKERIEKKLKELGAS